MGKEKIIQKSDSKIDHMERIEIENKYLEITEKYRIYFAKHEPSTLENKAISLKRSRGACIGNEEKGAGVMEWRRHSLP